MVWCVAVAIVCRFVLKLPEENQTNENIYYDTKIRHNFLLHGTHYAEPYTWNIYRWPVCASLFAYVTNVEKWKRHDIHVRLTLWLYSLHIRLSLRYRILIKFEMVSSNFCCYRPQFQFIGAYCFLRIVILNLTRRSNNILHVIWPRYILPILKRTFFFHFHGKFTHFI